MKTPILFLAGLLLVGCAATQGGVAPMTTRAERSQAKQLHTDLVREMIAQGRYYAALAHIEELQKSGGPRDELLLLHAQVLSKLDRRDEAEGEYRQLLGSAFDGEARHGLGLLYAEKNYPQSLLYLRDAARLRPTDAGIRNDYGYALMMGGQYSAARLHLATAYELNGAYDKYRNNYVLVLLLLKDEAEVQRVRRQSGFNDTILDNIRAQAGSWPAVVKRTQAAASAAPAPTEPAPAAKAPVPATERSDAVRQKLGTPSVN